MIKRIRCGLFFDHDCLAEVVEEPLVLVLIGDQPDDYVQGQQECFTKGLVHALADIYWFTVQVSYLDLHHLLAEALTRRTLCICPVKEQGDTVQADIQERCVEWEEHPRETGQDRS